MHAKQDDSGTDQRFPALQRYLPEVPVESQQYAAVEFGAIEQSGVAAARSGDASPEYVLTVCARLDRCAREVLIS